MKRTTVAVLFCSLLLFIIPAFAQQPGDPATKEDVQKLFDVMQSHKMFDSVMTSMTRQLPALTSSAL